MKQQVKESKLTKKHRKPPSLDTSFETPEVEVDVVQDQDELSPISNTQPSPARSRPSLVPRSTANRPNSSVFGSLRSMRSTYEDDAPLSTLTTLNTTTSSRAPSVNWADTDSMNARSKLVLHHGEVQTSSSMFRKKKEYLALTETHILRYKSQSKASESLSG